MNRFKKLFAGLAITALLASLVPTAVVNASYSEELEGAYDYAYAIGITTQSTIETANMYGSLIRSHMAKMMVNYAKEVLGQTPDTSIVCEFTDIANQSAELKGYIIEACQMGLMGIGITAFNPNGVVTRAQFGTVLSRALYGDTYNVDTNPYYAEHLQALKSAGVMTMIDNPNMNEVRGYVMLMMQRAAGGTTPAICDTPENVLACSLGLDTCPAECQTAEHKEGTLSLSSIGVDYTSIPKIGLISFGSIKLDAAGADIKVNSIKIKKQGLSTLDSAVRVFFEKDGVRVSGKASFSNDVATVSFTTPLIVKSSETIDVILQLTGAAGAEIQLVSTDINTSAATINGSFASALLRTADYTVETITAAAVANALNPKVDSTKLVELGQLNLTKASSTKAALVKSLTLNNSGSSSLSYLSDVAVYRDDVKVSTKTTVTNRTISFVLNDEIKDTQTSAINYVVKGKITNADRVNDTYNFYLRNIEDVTVVEKETSFRATISATVPAVMGLITIAGGDLRFNEGSISAMNVVPGQKNVVFYEGTIQAIQSIMLDKLTVTGNLNNTTALGFNDVLQNLYVKIGNTVISAEEIFAATGDKAFVFDGQTTVNGTVSFSIYGDIKDNSPAAKISFNVDAINLDDFTTKEYVDNGQAVTSSIGSIGGKIVTVTQADMTLSNNSATSQNVQKGDRNVILGELEFATTSDVVSKVYSFKADLSGGVIRQTFDGGSVTVYDEAGTALVSETIRTGATQQLTFVLPTALTVAKTTPLKLTVKLDQVANAVAPGNQLKLLFTGVNAKNIINQNTVPVAGVAGALLTVVTGGNVQEVTQTFSKKLVKVGTTAIIGSINIKAFDGSVVLKDFNIQLSGLATAIDASKLSSITLLENGVSIGTFTKTAGSAVLYVSGLNKTIALGETKTYEVQATFPSVSTSGDLMGSFVTKLNTATFESPYGVELTPLTTKNMSTDIKPVNEVLSITAIDGIKGSNYASYKITLNATKQVKIDGLKVSVGQNLTTSISGNTWTLTSAENGGVEYKTGTVLLGSNTITPTTAIDVIGERILYVNVENVTWAAGSGDPYVFIGLTDVDYEDVFDNASQYSHTAMLVGYKAAMTTISDLGVNIK